MTIIYSHKMLANAKETDVIIYIDEDQAANPIYIAIPERLVDYGANLPDDLCFWKGAQLPAVDHDARLAVADKHGIVSFAMLDDCASNLPDDVRNALKSLAQPLATAKPVPLYNFVLRSLLGVRKNLDTI